MKKRMALFTLVLVMLTAALVTGAAAAGTTSIGGTKYVYTRNGKPLNVRSWPDVNAALLGKIPYGTAVTVTGYTSDYTWASILYNGQNAYVMTQYLVDNYPGGGITPTPVTPTPSGGAQSLVNAMENEFRTYRVVEPYTVLAKPVRATGWVNLRYVPSTEFGHADNLYANTQLTVIAETTNWLQVRRNDTGVTGYVMRQYVISMGYGSTGY